jgi:hypothetical protein
VRTLALRLMAVAALLVSTGAHAQAPATPGADDLQILQQVLSECQANPDSAECAPLKPLMQRMAAIRQARSEAQVQHEAARAAAPPPPPEPATDAKLFAKAAGPGPKGEDSSLWLGSNVVLAANTDTKNASVTLNLNPNSDLAAANVFSLSAQTPIAQGQDFQNVATLDGLAKSSAVGFQFSHIAVGTTEHADVITSPAYQSQCRALIAVLAAHGVKVPPRYSQPNACSASPLAGALGQAKTLDDPTRKALAKQISDLKSQADATVDWVRMFSANAKVGYEDHSFFDKATLAKDSVSHVTYQAGAGFTQVFHGGDMSVTGQFNYQRAYKDASTQTVCQAAASGSGLKCVTGAIGPPGTTNKYLATVDFRHIWTWKLIGAPIGIDPTFTYDLHSHVYGFEVPIYVVANDSKSLTGGLRYDWTSDKHQSVVGVFVASAFCILPGYSGCTPSKGSGGQ